MTGDMDMATNKYTAQEVADAITTYQGLVTYAARYLGLHYTTVHQYIRRYEVCRMARDAAREKFLDDAEAGLIQAVKDKQSWAIQYVLGSVGGRERGYGKPLDREERAIEEQAAVKARIEDTVDMDE